MNYTRVLVATTLAVVGALAVPAAAQAGPPAQSLNIIFWKG